MTSRQNKSTLIDIGSGPDNGFDLAAGALALAAFDRPRAALDHYKEHLKDLTHATHASVQPSDLTALSRAGVLTKDHRWGKSI